MLRAFWIRSNNLQSEINGYFLGDTEAGLALRGGGWVDSVGFTLGGGVFGLCRVVLWDDREGLSSDRVVLFRRRMVLRGNGIILFRDRMVLSANRMVLSQRRIVLRRNRIVLRCDRAVLQSNGIILRRSGAVLSGDGMVLSCDGMALQRNRTALFLPGGMATGVWFRLQAVTRFPASSHAPPAEAGTPNDGHTLFAIVVLFLH